MQVSFVTTADRLEFLGNYDKRVKIVNAEQIPESYTESYYITFEFDDSFSINQIIQFFFHAGVTYGLDLKYSSYDNQPARVR